ncbi:MAG: phage major capsid protein [Planctomycetota bacterium]
MPVTKAELQELIEKAQEELSEGKLKELSDSISEIRAWGEDEGRVKEAESAIKQLEDEVKTLTTDVQRQLDAAARRAFDDVGNYRGCFGSEGQAREFGLNFIRLTAEGNLSTRAAEALEADHKEFFGRVKDVTGSDALIPLEHSRRVQRLVEDYGVFPAAAFRMPMSRDKLSFTRRVSGFRARKVGIGKTMTRSDMALEPVNLTADKWFILTSYPVETEADAAVAIAEMIATEMALGFSVALDEDALIGDGTPAYDNELGITTILRQLNGTDDGGGLVLGSGNTGDQWTGITKDDILKLYGQARYVRPGQGRLYCSNEFYFQVLAKLITDSGGVTRSEAEMGPRLQAWGVPVQITHVLPRTPGNSQIAAFYGDLYQSSTLGDRQQMSAETSREAYWESDEVGVKARARYAINNHTLGSAEEAGPVVGLITPAAA